MKRKYLSALLMGVLTLSSVSTFTSCKDYDDDINSLQEQVNKAALSSDVEALKTQVNNAATSAQNAATKAEEALTKAGANATEIATVKALATKNGTDVAKALTDAANAATAASNAATAASNAATAAATAQDSANAALTKIAGLDKELKNLALNAQSHVTATQLKNSLDSLSQVINEATSDSIANLTKIVNGYKGGINALYTAVTEVSLMGSWTSSDGNSIFNGQSNLWFQTGTIGANYTFGAKEKDDLEGEHSADPKKSYVKGASINFPSQFLVRINPVNAKITPDMIKLIDSKGNDLDKLVKVVDVEKYDNLLTRASETGLWTVKVQLQDGVKPENVAQIAENGQNILYAVAVNNTASQAETVADAASRYVVSTYDLTVNGAYDYDGAHDLGAVKVKAESKGWKTLDELKPTGSDLVYAANGEDILVSFENVANADRFYVVRDDKHAGESDASELNAWNSYEYKNLNKVVAVENGNDKATLNIKINGQVGDEVQFRIFAVNYDGTLVEQNGRPFRVYVGAQSTTTSVAGNLVATGKETMETGWLPITGSLKNGGSLPATVQVIVNGVKINAHVEYAKDNEGHPAADNSKIKFAKFSVAPGDLTKWADGATATGTIKDGENVTVNTISVSLTKVMPTAESTKDLMKYSWKDNQLSNDDVYTAYLYPAADAWTTANALTGYKDMNQAINGLKPNFVISIANAALKSENGKNFYKNALNVTATPWKVEVNNAKDDADVRLIDNETKHETTIGYNYGKISSVTPNEDYKIIVQKVQTVFACPLAETAQTYAWTQVPAVYNANGQVVTPAKDVNVLTYGSNNTVIPNIFDHLVAHNSFDNTVFGGKLSERYNKYVHIDAKLISKGSGLEDYYTASVTNGVIRFTKQSAATNPTADVESTLVLTMTDAFGHKNVYKLPFKVKRAE